MIARVFASLPTAAAATHLVSQSGGAAANGKLAPDAWRRNDGRWHDIAVPGGTVKVRFARWDRAGQAVYEAKGLASTVVVNAQSFNGAVNRVQQLVRYQALAPRPAAAGAGASAFDSTTVKAPSETALTIDLQDPSLRDGVVAKPWLTGEPFTYFSAPEVIIAAKVRGVRVQVVDLNAGRGNKNLRAYINLSNDARGGAMYALITASANPPFKVPAGAGVAFIKGHADMQDRIRTQGATAALADFAAAVVTLPRGRVSGQPVGTIRPLTSAVQPRVPPSKPVRPQQSAPFPRQSYRGTTRIDDVMDNVGRMVPGLNVNPQRSELNCLSAAVALERQRAGKPALALGQHVPYEHDVYAFYGRLPIAGVRQKSGRVEPFDMKSMLKHVESLPRGARGLLLVSPLNAAYGHALVIENVNGRAIIMDGQNGYVVHPKAISTGVTTSEPIPAGGSFNNMPDKPSIKYQFLRTDDVRSPGSALPKNVLQARVGAVDRYANKVHLDVIDHNGAVTKQVIDQSRTPGVLKGLVAGDNVYLVNDRSGTVRAPGLLIIKQSDGLKMMKRIESRQ